MDSDPRMQFQDPRIAEVTGKAVDAGGLRVEYVFPPFAACSEMVCTVSQF